MNEIEKMYSNAGVNYYESVCSIKKIFDTKFVDDCNFGINCYSCPLNKSPFTAEKQIELIKLLSYYYNITISKNFENDYTFQCEGDDMYMNSISVSDDDTEIFINIG